MSDRSGAKRPGVYEISCTINQRRYIGASSDTYNRICGHKARLRSRKHPLYSLQEDWESYGEASFNFRIIEYTDTATQAFKIELDLIENSIDKDVLYNPWKGYKPKIKRKKNNNSVAQKRHWNCLFDESLLRWVRAESKRQKCSINYYLCELIREDQLKKIANIKGGKV